MADKILVVLLCTALVGHLDITSSWCALGKAKNVLQLHMGVNSMTKAELSSVVSELKSGSSYPEISMRPLYNLSSPSYKRHYVFRGAIVQYLRWQCLRLDGTVDYDELDSCLALLHDKVVMIQED